MVRIDVHGSVIKDMCKIQAGPAAQNPTVTRQHDKASERTRPNGAHIGMHVLSA